MQDIKFGAILAFKNKQTIANLSEVGCYHCLKVFNTQEIKEWTDNSETAICPYCNVDSILPETDPSILKECQTYWF